LLARALARLDRADPKRAIAPRLGLAVALLLAALALGSCTTTPTLPLPPPVASVGVPEDGFAQIEGQVHALAYVSVLNEQSEQGVITRADTEGNFKTRIEAKSGDLLTLWQDLGDGEASEQKHLVVPSER
jgi:hypothetical protein